MAPPRSTPETQVLPVMPPRRTSHRRSTQTSTGGLALPDQTALVVNLGIGIANTGLNAAIGNASQQAARTASRSRRGRLGKLMTLLLQTSVTPPRTAMAMPASPPVMPTRLATIRPRPRTSLRPLTPMVSTMSWPIKPSTAFDFGIGFSNTGLNLAVGNVPGNAADHCSGWRRSPPQRATQLQATSVTPPRTVTVPPASQPAMPTPLAARPTRTLRRPLTPATNGFLLTDQTCRVCQRRRWHRQHRPERSPLVTLPVNAPSSHQTAAGRLIRRHWRQCGGELRFVEDQEQWLGVYPHWQRRWRGLTQTTNVAQTVDMDGTGFALA